MEDSKVLKGDSCEVGVICDSLSPDGIRLITVRLRYWRPIHSELMTHRVFSRNARSSRAVPVVTLLKEEIYTPLFGMNQPGMQSMQEAPPDLQEQWAREWAELAQITRNYVRRWSDGKMHKQWANRPLEWFGWIDVLVSSTDWSNWFALRNHPDAMPEIRELANLMAEAFNASTSREVPYGGWHLPYITEEDTEGLNLDYLTGHTALNKLKVLSAARCARISYKPFDGNADYDKEVERYNRLVGSAPVHASPTEHQATPDTMMLVDLGKGQKVHVWADANQQGNFVGWKQHRKEIPNEAEFDPHYHGETDVYERYSSSRPK